jgi:hypothetical protein
MLRIILTSLMMVSAIFWGIFPVNDNSPHNKILDYLKIKIKIDWKFHLFVGLTFFILGVLIAQTKSIQKIWF